MVEFKYLTDEQCVVRIPDALVKELDIKRWGRKFIIGKRKKVPCIAQKLGGTWQADDISTYGTSSWQYSEPYETFTFTMDGQPIEFTFSEYDPSFVMDIPAWVKQRAAVPDPLNLGRIVREVEAPVGFANHEDDVEAADLPENRRRQFFARVDKYLRDHELAPLKFRTTDGILHENIEAIELHRIDEPFITKQINRRGEEIRLHWTRTYVAPVLEKIAERILQAMDDCTDAGLKRKGALFAARSMERKGMAADPLSKNISKFLERPSDSKEDRTGRLKEEGREVVTQQEAEAVAAMKAGRKSRRQKKRRATRRR